MGPENNYEEETAFPSIKQERLFFIKKNSNGERSSNHAISETLLQLMGPNLSCIDVFKYKAKMPWRAFPSSAQSMCRKPTCNDKMERKVCVK
jgi:hypothetical protein